MADYREDWCLWCGAELPAERHWRKIYCNTACKNAAINYLIVTQRQAANLTPRPCVYCGTVFTPLRRRKARYCSSNCSRQANRAALRAAQAERTCPECGRLFRPSGRPDTPGTYCGKTCAGRGQVPLMLARRKSAKG